MTLHTGDCLEVMAGMPDASVDAVVTDPPYGLEFMGKGWDKFGVGSTTAGTTSSGWKPPSDSTSGEDGPGGEQVPGGNPAVRPKLDVRQPGDPTFHKSGAGPFDRATVRHGFYSGKTLPALVAFQAWCTAWGREALRVTVPGGYLLAFGGTRTHHRLVCGLEDAGWLIRDELDWIYASGFPKGRANLKPAHEPIVLARKPGPLRMLNIDGCRIGWESDEKATERVAYGEKYAGRKYGPAGDWPKIQGTQSAAGRWPANVVLTDPVFDGGVDGVVGGSTAILDPWFNDVQSADGSSSIDESGSTAPTLAPTNLGALHTPAPSVAAQSGSPAKPLAPSAAPIWPDGMLESTDPGSTPTGLPEPEREPNESASGTASGRSPGLMSQSDLAARSAESRPTSTGTTTTTPSRSMSAPSVPDAIRESTPASTGGYSRFFLISKADRGDREPVLRGQLDRTDGGAYANGKGMPGRTLIDGEWVQTGTWDEPNRNPRENAHPTVKPIELMRHLVRLVTPPGGLVLDPFLGSGTTAIACEMEGFAWIGIEKEAEYVAIAEARLNGVQKGLGLDVPAPTRKATKAAEYTGERHPGREWTKWREEGQGSGSR